jgi:probable HAF family extracellular repeat protein
MHAPRIKIIVAAIFTATFAACGDEPVAPASPSAVSTTLFAVSGTADAYSVVALPTLGGSGGGASGINEAGDVVGSSQLPGDGSSHATLWPADGGPSRDLGTLGGIYVNSGAIAINATGTIVGSSSTADLHQRATLWPAGGGPPRDLGALGGMFTESFALDINDAGDVVGISETPNHLSRRVTFWPAGGGPPRELVGLGGSEAEAYRINAAGDVVGWSQTQDIRRLATIWPAGGAPRALSGDLPFSNAWGINDAGDIVGTSQLGPTLWPAGGGPTRALGILSGAGSAIAFAINASGDVVGISGSQATLWPAGGAPVALPTPAGSSSSTWRINAAHRIVGSISTPSGTSRAVVWRPASASVVVTAPPNVAVGTDPGVCSGLVDPGVASATAGATISGTRSDGLALNAAYPRGTTTITWTATSGAGASASVAQTISVSDRESPTVSPPADVSVNNDPGLGTAPVNPGLATGADNCESPAVGGTRSDGLALDAPYPVGSTGITWTATDASGNAASVVQAIRVTDNEPPQLAVPADFSRDATSASGAAVTYAVTARDNVRVEELLCSQASGSTFPIGATTVTCTATDAAGLNATKAFTVTVRGASAQLVDLIELARGINLPASIRAQLTVALQTVFANPSARQVACRALTTFIAAVRAEAARPIPQIPLDRATELIASATQIRTVLGCQ